MLKKFLLTTTIVLLLVLNSFFVLGSSYTIDDGTGFPITITTDQLEWEIRFKSFGSENWTLLPTLTVSGDANYFTSIQPIKCDSYGCPPGYHAHWGAKWLTQVGGNPTRNYWVVDHYPSDFYAISRQPVGPDVDGCNNCVYNIAMTAYGDCYNHSAPEPTMLWDGIPCSQIPIRCYLNTSGGQECDYLETNNAICQAHTYGNRDCATCRDEINSCTETDYFCNGVYAEIEFFNGTSSFMIRSNNWGDVGDGEISYPDTSYPSNPGAVWWTDSSPGFINITQTITITLLPGVGQAYWADMEGNPINQTDLNDVVKLRVFGEAMAGEEVNYTVYECQAICQLTEGTIRWFDRKIAESSNEDFITWKANESGEYYFKVRIGGGVGDEVDSRDDPIYGILSVSETENNTAPSTKIIGPLNRQVYFLGAINFSQNSFDIDDNFNYSWDLGNGEIVEGNSATWENYNFMYTYKKPGQKNIVLTVTDERGLMVRDRISILIINSTYVLSYISEPEWGIDIDKVEITFNSTDSYSVNYNYTTGNVTCLAGTCPNRTQNCPPNPPPAPGCYLNITNTPNVAGFDDLNFSWIFDEIDLISGQNVRYDAKGMDGASFDISFSYPGIHWAKLNVSINPSGYTEVEFSNSFINICRKTVGSGEPVWEWWDENGIMHNPLTDEDACLGRDRVIGGGDCCPPGYTCTDMGSYALCQPGEGFCIEQNIISCSDYVDAENCSNWSQCPIEFFGGCGGTIEINETNCGPAFGGGTYVTEVGNSCGCEWNETENECKQKTDLWSTISTSTQLKHICYTEVTHGECIDGLRSENVVSNIVWDPSLSAEDIAFLEANCDLSVLCASYDGPSLCESPLIKLSFFTIRNIIITVCIIIFIYIIWFYRKKWKSEKQKRRKKR